MSLFSDTTQLNNEELFWLFYRAKVESGIYQLIREHPAIFDNDEKWRLLRNGKNSFGIVKMNS